MKYKTILVAVDLSEQSREILDSAHAIGQKSGAGLHLATVIKPMTQVYGGLDMAPISSGSISFEEEAEIQARIQLENLASDYGIPTSDVHVLLGSPAREVDELASKLKAELIVMGSHGRHGMNRLLGSTANAVLHHAQCNVLAVRLAFE
jgi:universal stress protein A